MSTVTAQTRLWQLSGPLFGRAAERCFSLGQPSLLRHQGFYFYANCKRPATCSWRRAKTENLATPKSKIIFPPQIRYPGRSLTGWATLNEGLSSVIPSLGRSLTELGAGKSNLPPRATYLKMYGCMPVLPSTYYLLVPCATGAYTCGCMHTYICRIQVHIQISNIIYYILNSTSCK